MTTADLVSEIVRCTAAAVLLCSGAAKHAAPASASRAVAELVKARALPARTIVRLTATLEVLAALALLVPDGSAVASALMLVLGTAFTAVGVMGATRRDAPACGCFGRETGQPLGWRNAAAGISLLSAALFLAGRQVFSPPGCAALTAAAAVLLCAWLYRDLIRLVPKGKH
jgi:hypothetical protein